jgi:hypothetical protein
MLNLKNLAPYKKQNEILWICGFPQFCQLFEGWTWWICSTCYQRQQNKLNSSPSYSRQIVHQPKKKGGSESSVIHVKWDVASQTKLPIISQGTGCWDISNWKSTNGHKHGKCLIQRPSQTRTHKPLSDDSQRSVYNLWQVRWQDTYSDWG